METIKKLVLPFIFLNLLILNGAVIYVWLIPKQQPENTPTPQSTSQTVYEDKCGEECQKYITEQLALYKLPTPKPTVKTTAIVVPTPVKTTSVSYFPIPGNGSSEANDWIDLPGTDFYFNLSDYSGLQSIYFLTNMRLLNGNGQAFIRLFDATHGIGVQGSEVSTGSQTSVAIESGQISFWQGNNLYRVQAKSLTADTAIFDSGRLKITTKN